MFTLSFYRTPMIFYNTLINVTLFVEHGQQQYEAKQKQREIALLTKPARKHNVTLNMQLGGSS